ncbi:MAG: ABC transporter ATP-binding protein [Chloroflexi bacterium]|nr:MAG: ABC transporter ATP-binding protein [Chloroflexota bacterium]
MYAISTDRLTRDFASVRAVDNLTLEVPFGTVFGFLGPNGAGKTTTIRLLLGLLEPTSGTAAVLGRDIQSQADEIRERCGALLEYNGLYERMSAEDNLEFYGRVWKLSPAERKNRAEELLKHFGLWDRRKDLARDWSRGMKQKLAIARTLLHKPELVFLDEPTAGLDPVAAVSLREDLAGLAGMNRTTIFLNTHNLGEAEKLCNQVGVIRKGKLVAVGSVEELRSSSGKPQATISGSNFSELGLSMIRQNPDVAGVTLNGKQLTIELKRPIDVAPLVSQLVANGAMIEEVRKGQASLEDVFLTLMNEEQELEVES